MALAPKAPRNEPSNKGGNRSSVKSAEGKAAQRARNKEATGTQSGSSGAGKSISKYPALNWEEVEQDVRHVADFSAKITQAQLGSFGYFNMGMNLPESYAHAAIDAAMASRDAMVYIRVYQVPIDMFIERLQQEAAEQAAEQAAAEGGE